MGSLDLACAVLFACFCCFVSGFCWGKWTDQEYRSEVVHREVKRQLEEGGRIIPRCEYCKIVVGADCCSAVCHTCYEETLSFQADLDAANAVTAVTLKDS